MMLDFLGLVAVIVVMGHVAVFIWGLYILFKL